MGMVKGKKKVEAKQTSQVTAAKRFSAGMLLQSHYSLVLAC